MTSNIKPWMDSNGSCDMKIKILPRSYSDSIECRILRTDGDTARLNTKYDLRSDIEWSTQQQLVKTCVLDVLMVTDLRMRFIL